MRFWRNPEFVRHARAELRPVRMITSGLVVLVICLLIGLVFWSAMSREPARFYRVFYTTLLTLQGVVITFWCLLACGHAVAREREMKTYDFLRTTRMTSTELLIGKALGAPVLGYFCFACVLPIAVVTGLLAGFSLGTIFWAHVLILAFALLMAVGGLWLSMLLEKSSASPAVLTLLLGWPLVMGGIGMARSAFPGFAGITPLLALFSLHGSDAFDLNEGVVQSAPVFGVDVSIVALSLLLYLTFGAWLVLMLRRNLKNERSELHLLSRPQALGFVAYFNLLFSAFLDPSSIGSGGPPRITAAGVSSAATGWNAFLLFLVALATLTPAEQLRRWYRMRAAGKESYLSPQGLAWPWLITTAVAGYCFLAMTVLIYGQAGRLQDWNLGRTGLLMAVILVYVIRDATFLQWCMLTQLKQPVIKGFLYLILYYAAAGIVSSVVSTASAFQGLRVLDVLTPARAFNPNVGPLGSLLIGMGLQTIVIGLLLKAVSRRLARPVASGSSA